jgi:hypothetical protein
MATKKPEVVVNHRNSIDGRFVKETYTKTHPNTTTTERNPRSPSPPPKRSK